MSDESLIRLFVYGTLRRGEANHHLLLRATYVREAVTPPAYTLFACDGHPAMGDGGTTTVVGEVFDVDDATLATIDRLEDHPTWYRRQLIVLADGDSAWAYLLPPHFTEGRARIAGGDWVAWRRGG